MEKAKSSVQQISWLYWDAEQGTKVQELVGRLGPPVRPFVGRKN